MKPVTTETCKISCGEGSPGNVYSDSFCIARLRAMIRCRIA